MMRNLTFKHYPKIPKQVSITRPYNIAVAGTGYVGLISGVSSPGHKVTCVDIDEQKMTMLQQGISQSTNRYEELMCLNKKD